MAVSYTFRPIQSLAEVNQALNEISQALTFLNNQNIEFHSEPNPLINGMIVLADGTNWKPNGTGTRGFYGYDSTSNNWIKLG